MKEKAFSDRIRFIVAVTFTLMCLKGCEATTKYTVFMVHAEPYSWQNGSRVVGLIPNLFKILSVKCENLEFEIMQVHWSMEELRSITVSTDPLSAIKKRERLTNINQNIIIGMNNNPNFFESPRKFHAYPFVYSRGIVAVVHRDTIGLGQKLYLAMADSAIIMYNGVLMAVIVGVLIWVIVSDTKPLT